MKKILLLLCAIFFITGSYATGIGANDTTANCDNNTLGQTSGTSNMEIDWEPNTINIRWYDGETQLNVQSSAQSCVYSEDLYLPAQPTKTGYTFKGWEVKYAIPAEYTELEYIESTGTQWVDTGVMVYSDVSVEAVVQGSGGGGVVFSFDGPRTGAYIADNGSHFYMAGLYGNQINNSLTKTLIVSKWTGENGAITQTGSLGGQKNTPFTSSIISYKTLTLFKGSDVLWAGKVYSLKIYDNTSLIHNFIPVLHNSDNLVGLWDSIDKIFITNAEGTGTLVAGPVVQ